MIKKRVLADIEPNGLALLISLGVKIDDSMLKEIANSDYGIEADEHLLYLKKIRDKQEFTSPLNWHPREVLELTKLGNSTSSSSTFLREHLMRAFSCTALLYAASLPENDEYFSLYGENDTVAPLLESLKYIDNIIYMEQAAKLIAYRLVSFSEEKEARPFLIFALLVLSVRLHASATFITNIVNWLIEDEQRVRDAWWSWASCSDDYEPWLLGLTVFDMRHDKWVEMAHEIKELAEQINEPETKKLVIGIAEKLINRFLVPRVFPC